MARLSADEKAWNSGWTCDTCDAPIDRFKEPTAGRQDDEQQKISRHASCDRGANA